MEDVSIFENGSITPTKGRESYSTIQNNKTVLCISFHGEIKNTHTLTGNIYSFFPLNL